MSSDLPALFHIARRADWEAAHERGEYRISTLGRTLEDIGYIHCSFAPQVLAVANAVFRGEDCLVVLAIDSARVGAEVRVENLEGGSELFPHIYGPLPVAAVVAVETLAHGPRGDFLAPPMVGVRLL